MSDAQDKDVITVYLTIEFAVEEPDEMTDEQVLEETLDYIANAPDSWLLEGMEVERR